MQWRLHARVNGDSGGPRYKLSNNKSRCCKLKKREVKRSEGSGRRRRRSTRKRSVQVLTADSFLLTSISLTSLPQRLQEPVCFCRRWGSDVNWTDRAQISSSSSSTSTSSGVCVRARARVCVLPQALSQPLLSFIPPSEELTASSLFMYLCLQSLFVRESSPRLFTQKPLSLSVWSCCFCNRRIC